MARETAHIVLKANGKVTFLKVVRSGTVSNLARKDLIARALGRDDGDDSRNRPHHLQDNKNKYECVLRVVPSGEDSSASTLGRGDRVAGESARITVKTIKEFI
jgi:hypothetical protein